MKIPFTRKDLEEWAGPRTFRDAKILFENNRVETVRLEPPFVHGTLEIGPRGMKSRFELLKNGLIENHCPCRMSREQGVICPHVIALGLELVRRNTDPERGRKAEEEERRARRMSSYNEADYLTRVPENTPGATPALLRLKLPGDWTEARRTAQIPLHAEVVYDGRAHDPGAVPRNLPLAFSKADENLLFVLEDIAEGPLSALLMLSASDFLNILRLCIGKPILIEGAEKPSLVNAPEMCSVLQLDMDRENGELLITIYTELPFSNPGEFPVYIISGKEGWIYSAGNFWPLKNILPQPLHSIYSEPVVIPREAVPNFFKTELPMLREHMPIIEGVSEDLYSFEPEQPAFRVTIKGSPGAVTARLKARYGDIDMPAARPDPQENFAHPDPDDLMRYTVRNRPAELQAVRRLNELGFNGKWGDSLSSIEGPREVLNFLGSTLPKIRRLGWRVELDGPVADFMDELDFVTPVVNIRENSEHSWFEVGFNFETTDGGTLSAAEVQRALQRGESYVKYQGRTILLDADAINTARDVFSDCAVGEGSEAGMFRMDSMYSAYVQSSLDALDGIDVEADKAWMERARSRNRGAKLQPVPLPDGLGKVLRHYQKDGVYWLRFLEETGCSGILADEMGLGKTLQTLTWLKMKRIDESAQNKPALIICPTSLVFNWVDEAEKWTPDLKVLAISGADRHLHFEKMPDADLIITSYALLRRDVDEYLEHEFCVIVLDEAQHIKNHSTRNAVAAKKLKGVNKLVLTGTPLENSVADLWSIMDFLMPGYMGGYKAFRENYELPIGRGGADADLAQLKLRRKLHPFLLRRLKKDVAKDLPPKIIKLAHCELTKDQQTVYRELLEASRRRIKEMVAEKGFNRCRMEILKTLLRLRQTACHLDLLKNSELNSSAPSGKMDLFFEMLDEAIDGGHRVLVFSQFTSMLAILRNEMEERDIRYCYLDGSTKNRMEIVREFNTEKSIPAFLISLKAGGTGLNLTGADMVIHFDPWWNPAVEAQATDRAYRIGQKRTVYSVKLITKGTVEEKVLEMQNRKQAVIDATLSKDEEVMEKLTWEDVQKLLEL